MFDRISPTYDRVNRLMTAGLDKAWRKKVASFVPKRPHLILLDCATGTGDQIFSLLDAISTIDRAVGVDMSEEMLKRAQSKSARRTDAKKIEWVSASASDLPFPEKSFDCVTISFGVRNFENLEHSLKECLRILKPQGRLLILETSLPKNSLIKKLSLLYLRHLLPKIGGWVSKQREAYVYLNQTVETFPSGESFCAILEQAGFSHVHLTPLTFGAVSIYRGDRPA